MHCIHCGETMEGDGYTVVYHCPNYEGTVDAEPDTNPVYCTSEEKNGVIGNTKQFQAGDTITCVADRDVPITAGKLYTVIEYIPDYTNPDSVNYT